MNRLKKIGILLGLSLVAFFLAQGVFYLRAEPAPLAPAPVSSASGMAATAPWGKDLNWYLPIAERNLLAVLNLPPEAERRAAGLDSLQDSRLGWKLLGTIVSSDPSLSRVIVLVNGKQESYGRGFTVGGWVIARIERRAIVLSHGDLSERLLIDDPASLTGSPVGNTDGEAVRIARSSLKAQLSDIQGLARDVSMAPASSGAHSGMRITSLRAGSLMQELGLQQGDLVLSANNTPIRSFADLGAITNLADAPAITLTVLRNEKEISFQYALSE